MTSEHTDLGIGMLGLGEAGAHLARDLVAAGVAVRGYDPLVEPPEGVVACRSDAEAATGVDLVLSANSAHDAEEALVAGLPGLGPHAVWADLNTASPAVKRRLGRICDEAGRAFADVAVMAPVPPRGLRTPMVVSGAAAGMVVSLLTPLGASVTALDGPPGLAATRKLLRSVFFKGLSAAVVEALAAARAAGAEDWLRANISDELTAADASTLARIENGTHRHARRRAEEMRAASELLDELAVPALVSRASQAWLEDLTGATES
ncbi:MAG TPA: DUF1932 domain-containing protein [Acidimicrobiales bacterium]|nr:DUF1932 domain-containing protein [Acidimicrobiales bacterium]